MANTEAQGTAGTEQYKLARYHLDIAVSSLRDHVSNRCTNRDLYMVPYDPGQHPATSDVARYFLHPLHHGQVR